jgi:diguanylate cyclase (GGDEF)-like protein/PAS domain S-box-containing protein
MLARTCFAETRRPGLYQIGLNLKSSARLGAVRSPPNLEATFAKSCGFSVWIRPLNKMKHVFRRLVFRWTTMNALDLLAALPLMLWTARADGVWTHVNPRWAAYTGITSSDQGFGFEEALHPDDVAPTVARWKAAVASGQPYQAEYRLRRFDGEYRWYLTQGMQTGHPDSDVAWSGACTDIHDQKVAEQEAQLTREQAVRALGLTLEARDAGNQGHTDRVTALAVRLGQTAGLDTETLETLRLGAYLHDIGKIAISDAILNKPGALTAGEHLEMQRHVLEGERFAAPLGFLDGGVLDVIRGHHERWDGTGYPAGVRATEIPLLARIFALADVYDALVSERPYKAAWPMERALAEVSSQRGRQFDPELTDLFVQMMTSSAPISARPEPQAPVVGLPGVPERIRALALHESNISVLITDAQQRLLYVNPAFSRVTGYSAEEVLGLNPRFLQGQDTDPEDRRRLREELKAGRPVQQLILNYSRSGEALWFEMHITPVLVGGELSYYLAIQSDSSERVADRDRLHHSATRDDLTGLLNRYSLNRALAATTVPAALIFLDLDNFKGINDRYGHGSGDEVLRQVADTLRRHVPGHGQAFRLGGDEFLVLLPTDEDAAVNEAVWTLRQALADVETEDGVLTGSFGVASFPREGRDLWQLIGLADERMYQEKLGHANRRSSSVRMALQFPEDGNAELGAETG